MSLLPPPERQYEGLSEAYEDLLKHAKDNGYEIRKVRSKTDKRNPPTVRRCDVGCDQRGVYTPHGTKRITGTRRVGCPFEVAIIRVMPGSWRTEVKNSTHNHESSPAIVHPCH